VDTALFSLKDSCFFDCMAYAALDGNPAGNELWRKMRKFGPGAAGTVYSAGHDCRQPHSST
jgi:hypothetical protein